MRYMPAQHATVPVSPYSPPRFDADDPKLLEYLEEHGYAVVRSALDPASPDMARIHGEFWDFHEMLGGVHRDDCTTWGRDFIAHPATGIIAGFGFGQSRFCWSLRCLPAVRTSFEAIWGTSDLITSFDGGNAFRPMPEWRTQGGWWHCDQNGLRPHRSGKVCVQGMVLLTPANEFTGGFCVVPGTHRQHAEYSARHPWGAEGGDFLPVPEADPILDSGGVLLCAEPGDLVLWDSRTIHCNTPAIATHNANADPAVPMPHELLRLAGYVCFTPASWCPVAVLKKRARAALELTTSTHWPHDFVPTGAAPPWMVRRKPSDYTGEETRLILGDHGLWPSEALEQPGVRRKEGAVPGVAAVGKMAAVGKVAAMAISADPGMAGMQRRGPKPAGMLSGAAAAVQRIKSSTGGSVVGSKATIRPRTPTDDPTSSMVGSKAMIRPGKSMSMVEKLTRESGYHSDAAGEGTLLLPVNRVTTGQAQSAIAENRNENRKGKLRGRALSSQPNLQPDRLRRSSGENSSGGSLLGRLYGVLSPRPSSSRAGGVSSVSPAICIAGEAMRQTPPKRR